MSKKTIQRIVILGGIIIIVVLFIVFDLEQYLTLSYLKSSKESFAALYGNHPVLVTGSYMLIYIVVTGISLPGAAILTLAGGALFGFVVGTIAVSFASTIGATLALVQSLISSGALYWALNRPSFFWIWSGGIFFRLTVFIVTAYVIYRFTSLSLVATLVTLVTATTVFMVTESAAFFGKT